MSEKFNVVVHSLIVDDPYIEEEILSSIANIIFIPNNRKKAFYESIKEADGIIIADRKMDVNTINKLSRCKVISRQGVGLDNIDLNQARKKGILVANVSDYCIEDVANYTVANILSLSNYMNVYDNHVKKGIWDINSISTTNNIPPIRRINAQVLGVVGFGKIAKSVVDKMKCFGVEILVYSTDSNKGLEKKYGIRYVDFETLLERSDIITLHIPLNEETIYMFNMEVFKKMKKTAFLINTSRGPIINEKDLYIALKEKVIAGAAIDVMEEEPPKPNNPLLTLDNIIITPHIAFFSEDSYKELRVKAAENIKKAIIKPKN